MELTEGKFTEVGFLVWIGYVPVLKEKEYDTQEKNVLKERRRRRVYSLKEEECKVLLSTILFLTRV
jgi:hypothetical protein